MKMRGIEQKPFLHASELHEEELFMRKALLSYERISEPPPAKGLRFKSCCGEYTIICTDALYIYLLYRTSKEFLYCI